MVVEETASCSIDDNSQIGRDRLMFHGLFSMEPSNSRKGCTTAIENGQSGARVHFAQMSLVSECAWDMSVCNVL